MRSAELASATDEASRDRVGATLLRRAAILVVAAGVAACSSVGDPTAMFKGSGAGGDSTPAGSAPSGPPVDAPTQKAFDDAGKALRAGQTAEAERAYRALAQARPELGGPHANLGMIYRQQGKLAESQAELEQAVKVGPRQAVYYNQLAITYRQQGAFEKARAAYERAIAIDPQYAAALLNLGILNDLYLGNAPRALELYGRYLALSPNGDAAVTKWVADLKNRKPQPNTAAITVSRKEQE